MTRTAVSIIVLLIYVILYNWYLYELTHSVTLNNDQKCVIYNCIVLPMIIYTYLDKQNLTELHWQFNLIGFMAIVINFILVIFIRNGFLRNPMYMLVSFNGGILLATLMILISGIRHDLFKN